MGGLMNDLLVWAEHLIKSPWIYLILLGFSAFDAVVPAFPSESLVIAAATFAKADGEPKWWWILVFAAAGAILGDHIAYGLGRTFSGPAMRFMEGGTSRKKALDWATQGMKKRGGSLLIVARFIPGGRTALTVSMGATKHPLSHFTPWVVTAGVLWALYGTGIGFLGGAIFHENPMWGVAFGLALAIGLSLVIEYVRGRREKAREQESMAAGTGSTVYAPDAEA